MQLNTFYKKHSRSFYCYHIKPPFEPPFKEKVHLAYHTMDTYQSYQLDATGYKTLNSKP